MVSSFRRVSIIIYCFSAISNTLFVSSGIVSSPDYFYVDGRETSSLGTGAVGIVYQASAHYAIVMPLLNSKSNISCKIKSSGYFGYLRWDGKDARYTYLYDLPRHAECHPGDTIVTSGYSSIFPEGLMVGVVEDIEDSHDGLSYLLKVRLSADFGRVRDVRVIARKGMDEFKTLTTINE